MPVNLHLPPLLDSLKCLHCYHLYSPPNTGPSSGPPHLSTLYWAWTASSLILMSEGKPASWVSCRYECQWESFHHTPNPSMASQPWGWLISSSPKHSFIQSLILGRVYCIQAKTRSKERKEIAFTGSGKNTFEQTQHSQKVLSTQFPTFPHSQNHQSASLGPKKTQSISYHSSKRWRNQPFLRTVARIEISSLEVLVFLFGTIWK